MYLRETSSHVYIISPHPACLLAHKPVEPLWVRFASEGRRVENYLLNWRMREISYNSAFCDERPFLSNLLEPVSAAPAAVINVAKHQVENTQTQNIPRRGSQILAVFLYAGAGVVR